MAQTPNIPTLVKRARRSAGICRSNARDLRLDYDNDTRVAADDCLERARIWEDEARHHDAVADALDSLSRQLAEAQATIDEAMRVLAPNMPESGLVDACRQVKQVAISEADNAEKAQATIARLERERDEARK
jgi:hypothetical protein